jgi:hypothetical protein
VHGRVSGTGKAGPHRAGGCVAGGSRRHLGHDGAANSNTTSGTKRAKRGRESIERHPHAEHRSGVLPTPAPTPKKRRACDEEAQQLMRELFPLGERACPRVAAGCVTPVPRLTTSRCRSFASALQRPRTAQARGAPYLQHSTASPRHGLRPASPPHRPAHGVARCSGSRARRHYNNPLPPRPDVPPLHHCGGCWRAGWYLGRRV